MTTQQPLFPEDSQPATAGPTPVGTGVSAPAPVWLQRMSLLVLVLFCLYIGVLMAVLPWSPRYWDENTWLRAHPPLYMFLQHGWVRGTVSGIGLIDIWIGISEAIHYRDYRP